MLQQAHWHDSMIQNMQLLLKVHECLSAGKSYCILSPAAEPERSTFEDKGCSVATVLGLAAGLRAICEQQGTLSLERVSTESCRALAADLTGLALGLKREVVGAAASSLGKLSRAERSMV